MYHRRRDEPIEEGQEEKKISLGYGFITFEDEVAATHALSEFQALEIDGRVINLEHAKPMREARRGRSRRGRGGVQRADVDSEGGRRVATEVVR